MTQYEKIKEALKLIAEKSTEPEIIELASGALPTPRDAPAPMICEGCGAEIPRHRKGWGGRTISTPKKYCSSKCRREAVAKHPAVIERMAPLYERQSKALKRRRDGATYKVIGSELGVSGTQARGLAFRALLREKKMAGSDNPYEAAHEELKILAQKK